MSFSSNASTCLRCPAHKAKWIDGKLVCAQDGVETRLHAERGDCPLKLFSPSGREAWSTEQPSRGLGDTIAKFTHATGIDKAAHLFTQVTGIDCGCEERREQLNAAKPYPPEKPRA